MTSQFAFEFPHRPAFGADDFLVAPSNEAAVAVRAPDDALIGAVLLKLFADRQLEVGEDVVVFLLRHMERSFAAARRIVAALDRAALVARRRITVPLAREVLAAEGRPGGAG